MATVTKLKAKREGETKQATIKPPNYAIASVIIRGTAPYIQNRFSSKNREAMQKQQEEGSSFKRTRKAKAPKDFNQVYESSLHRSKEGWFGVPASALRRAMIDACRLTEVDMTRAKMAIFIVHDGLDAEDSTPLVRLNGKPKMRIDRVRIGINSTDLAARAVFEEWGAKITIRWDADLFTAQDIVNLLARAGWQVGIGAGRPLSTSSAGMGMGTWEVESS